MSIPLFQIDAAPWSPWVMYGKGNDTSVRGIAIEIYEAMRKKRIFDYEIQKEALYGGIIVNGKWTGLIGAMIDNLTDIGGPLYLTEGRTKFAQYSSPVDYCKVGILSGMVPANKNPFLVFGLFSVQVWSLILLSIFLVAGAANLMYAVLPSAYKKKKMEAFVILLWMFEATLLGKEFGANSKFFLRHIWKAPSFKLLQGMWIMSCLVLTYTFQGNIISAYTADKMKPKYETLDDLMADPRVVIGTYGNSYLEICMQKMANTEYDDIWRRVQKRLLEPSIGIPAHIDDVEQGKAVYVFEYAFSKNLIGERFKKTGKCSMRVSAIDYCAGTVGIVNRKGLPESTIKKFNDGVKRFFEGGLQKLYFTETSLFHDICTDHGASATNPLVLSDLIGAFTVLGAGLSLSLICFALEITVNRIRRLLR